jgi:ubiquinone/menaquinone biosynthesis C-methylase UbiE
MEDLFDQRVAEQYDRWYLSPAGRHAERVENRLILELLRPRPGQCLLDVGCGTGNHLLLFQQHGLDVTGIDPSEPMLDVARDKLGHRAELRVGVAEDLPFDDNAFDLVTLIATLEFCQKPYRALAEAFRVAKEAVFVGVLNRFSAQGIHAKAEGLLKGTLYRHARCFSIWELRYMVQSLLGPCPMFWGSVIWLPLKFHSWDAWLHRWIPYRRNPFGAFLGMRVDMVYTHQARLHPLHSRVLGKSHPEAHPGALGRFSGKPLGPQPSGNVTNHRHLQGGIVP